MKRTHAHTKHTGVINNTNIWTAWVEEALIISMMHLERKKMKNQ